MIKFIKKYLQKKELEKRTGDASAVVKMCCDVFHPIAKVKDVIERDGKYRVDFDLLVIDREIFIEGKSLGDAKIFNEVLKYIEADPQTNIYKKTEKVINLGGGADWHLALINWVADNQALTALANLATPAVIGAWLIKKIKELRQKYPDVIRIGPASARSIAFTEVSKKQNFKKLEVIWEYQGSSQENEVDIDYFVLLRGEVDRPKAGTLPASAHYLVRITWKGVVAKLISLES